MSAVACVSHVMTHESREVQSQVQSPETRVMRFCGLVCQLLLRPSSADSENFEVVTCELVSPESWLMSHDSVMVHGHTTMEMVLVHLNLNA